MPSVLIEFWRSASPAMRQHIRQLMVGDEAAKIAAIQALVAAGGPTVALVLAARLPDPSPTVTDHLLHGLAALSLELAKEVALKVAESGDSLLSNLAYRFLFKQTGSRMAVGALYSLPPAGSLANDIEPLLTQLGNAQVEARIKAVRRLVSVPGEATLALLRRCLRDPSAEVVREALAAINQLAPNLVRDAVAQVFRCHSTASFACAAAIRLIQLGNDGLNDVVRRITDWVPETSDPEQRERTKGAAQAIAFLRFDETLRECACDIHSRDPETRTNAAFLAGVIGSMGTVPQSAFWQVRRSKCIETILPLLRDGDANVRINVLWSLGELEWIASAEQIEQWLIDSSTVIQAKTLEMIAHRGLLEHIDHVLRMISAASRHVRKTALEAADTLAVAPDTVLERIRQMLHDGNAAIRAHGVELLGQRGAKDDVRPVRAALRDRDALVRGTALQAIRRLTPQQWRGALLDRLSDSDNTIRIEAVRGLAELGNPDDVDAVLKRFDDEIRDVRLAALQASVTLAPERRAEFAVRLLVDEDSSVCQAAVDCLEEGRPESDIANIALNALPRARGIAGGILLDLIGRHAPATRPTAIASALRSKSWKARLRAACEFPRHFPDRAIEELGKLTRDRDEDVRRAAFRQMFKLTPGMRGDLVQRMLEDKAARVRELAVRYLRRSDDPWMVDRLLPLTRDEASNVRAEALKAVVKFDDVRVLSELTSSLNDVAAEVRELAQAILDGKEGDVPVLSAKGMRKAGVAAVRAKVDQINMWASQIGWELLGRPVVVLNYRQSLGRTRDTRKQPYVEIEVTDTPVTTGHPHGEQIMKGLALHEIGHHLFDIGVRGDLALRGIARSEGVYDVYHILTDERLERALRSRRPEWGIYFDRVASYAFAQSVRAVPLDDMAALVGRTAEDTLEAMKTGRLPGRIVDRSSLGEPPQIALSDSDMLKIPGLVPLHAAFTACLRCGFDPRACRDPKVTEAMAQVPANLKDLPNSEVLEVARRISQILGKSDRYKQDMAALRRRLARQRRIRRVIDQMLDRLAQTGNVPEWLNKEVLGIRRNRQVIYRPLKTHSRGLRGGWAINLGKDLKFEPLPHEQEMRSDPHRHAQLVGSVRKHVHRLRAYLEHLGRKPVEEYARRRGRRLDVGAVGRALLTRSPNMLIHARDEIRPDAYIGVLIDRSGSMEGDKIELARRFGALVAESAKGLRGIEGHVNAFDGDTFYLLGNFQRHAIEQLEADDGNNDAGGLQRAAGLALRSRKRNKLLIMVSDGSPTECSVDALRGLVQRLTHNHGITCVQAAVDQIDHDCFPRFVDLSRFPIDEAVGRFGKMLIELTRSWR